MLCFSFAVGSSLIRLVKQILLPAGEILKNSKSSMPSISVSSDPSALIVISFPLFTNAIFFPFSNHCGELPPEVVNCTGSPPAEGILKMSVFLTSVGRSIVVTVYISDVPSGDNVKVPRLPNFHIISGVITPPAFSSSLSWILN